MIKYILLAIAVIAALPVVIGVVGALLMIIIGYVILIAENIAEKVIDCFFNLLDWFSKLLGGEDDA